MTSTPEVDLLAARFTDGEIEHPHAMAFCEKARELERRLTAARKHLLTYGAHTPVCRGADNCDCGFSEVQKGLPATPDFLALLKEVSDRALDNMEGEDAEGFNRWEKVHTTAEDLIRAIALAEGRKT